MWRTNVGKREQVGGGGSKSKCARDEKHSCVCRADDARTNVAVTVPGLTIMAMTTRTNFVLAASMATAQLGET